MNIVLESLQEAGLHFDDDGLNAQSAHRIGDLFSQISLVQEQLGVIPTEPSPELIALEGYVQDALYKENVLNAEEQLEQELKAAERQLALRESWSQSMQETGADRLIAEDQANDLRAWRDRRDKAALNRHSTRAENAANDARRLEESRDKVASLKSSLASHRKQHSAIYGIE